MYSTSDQGRVKALKADIESLEMEITDISEHVKGPKDVFGEKMSKLRPMDSNKEQDR